LNGGRVILQGNYIESAGPGITISSNVDAALIQGNMIAPHGFSPLVLPQTLTSQMVIAQNCVCKPRPEPEKETKKEAKKEKKEK